MAGDPVPSEERQRRLQQVRDEIERGTGQGITFSADDWLRRHPDLEPELGAMLRELTGMGQTQVATSPAVDTPGASETLALPPSPSPELPPAETIAIRPTPLPPPLPPRRWPSCPTPLPPKLMAISRSPSPDSPLAETIALSTSQGQAGANRAGPSSDLETAQDVAQPAGLATGRKVRYIGDYEIISTLGQGGMGIVYKARQVTLNRPVALKMIRNAEFASEDQVRRFQNEAEAVATLDHPGIVPIYEVGTYEDQRYFSMKLVEGQGLDKKLEELAKDPRAAARIVAEVADAVNHAHQRGILHRDLKPANILVDGLGHTHVTDFGLAKRIEDDAGLTVSGAIMGTPSYMAPEQAAGQSSLVTTASDVYGLGAILYAVLTGRAPFASDSVMNTLDQVRNSPPQPPTRLNAKLPRDLEVICLKCLEKDPRHRYASAQALADDLNRWLRGEPIAARPVGPVVRLRMWAKRKPADGRTLGRGAHRRLDRRYDRLCIAWQWREAVSQRNQAQIARDAAVHQEQTARKAEAEARIARDQAVASEKKAVAARAQAEQNAQIAGMQATLALNTIQDLVSQVQKGLQGPGLYDLKTALLDSALKRIDGVAGIYEKSTSKEATTAAALMELGKIYPKRAVRPDPEGLPVVPEMPRDHQGTRQDQEL